MSTLGIGCHCRTERGSGQGYTCHYFGDPDDCDVYQEDGKKFYLHIIQHISGILWELSTSSMEHEVCLALSSVCVYGLVC